MFFCRNLSINQIRVPGEDAARTRVWRVVQTGFAVGIANFARIRRVNRIFVVALHTRAHAKSVVQELTAHAAQAVAGGRPAAGQTRGRTADALSSVRIRELVAVARPAGAVGTVEESGGAHQAVWE